MVAILIRYQLLHMKISIFKQKKNRRYNYTPRYYSGKEVGNLYDFDSKFSKYRETFNRNDFGRQWQDTRLKMRNRSNRGISIRLIIIILILVIFFLFIIDFDLFLFVG